MHPTEPAAPGQDPTEKTDVVERLQHRAGCMSSREGQSYQIPHGSSNLLLEAAGEITRLRTELTRLIDGHISASGPFARQVSYTVFPDSIAERKFDTREQARAYVRRMVGLEVES